LSIDPPLSEAMAKVSKVSVSIPGALLEKIDRDARDRGMTRSGFLVEAARRELEWTSSSQIDAATERGRAALAGVGRFECADLTRADRAKRDFTIDVVVSDIDGKRFACQITSLPSTLRCQLAPMSRTGKSVSAALRESGEASVHSSASSIWANAM
jgi:hypothetical protein